MNQLKNIPVINKARRLLKNTCDKYHNIDHTKSVLATSKLLLKYYPEANKEAVIISAWWHDVGRLYIQEGHEEMSAELISGELRKRGYEEDFIKTVSEATRFHKWNMKPSTIEGKIIRDADKLDFINIDRWQRSIRANQHAHLLETNMLLDKLRDEILTLPESKKIYDNRYQKFKRYHEQIVDNLPPK